MTGPRFLSRLGGLLSIVLFVGVGAAGVASADPTLGSLDPHAEATLTLHKLEQPENMGAPATGLPLDATSTDGMEPIAGVTFEARKVPGIDLTKAAGWDRARGLNASDAADLVAGEPAADSGVTDAAGTVEFGGLDVGLYYVSEVNAPAGVVASAPFLVSLPTPHPTEDSWLYSVHVYPKNARVNITLDVHDADAILLGDTVTWTAHADIPRHATISNYVVRNVLAPGVDLIDDASKATVAIDVAGVAPLVLGTDYTIAEFGMDAGFAAYTAVDASSLAGGHRTAELRPVANVLANPAPVADGERGFDVVLTASGRAKLEQHSGAQVTVIYPSRVTWAGEQVNQARLYINDAAVVSDTAVTKFGPLEVLVHEKDNPSNPIAGATFRLYLTPEDALAGKNWVTVNGQSEWVTDAQGNLSIGVVRFSNHTNGLDRDPSDPLYRLFYVAPIGYPAGWTGSMDPQAGAVTSAEEPLRLVFEVWHVDSPPPTESPNPTPSGQTPSGKPGEPKLPVTGASVAGASLLAVTLVAVGIVLVRRRTSEGDEL